MEVLITGGDTELGRAVAEGFHNDGHTVTLLGVRRDDLEVAAKEIEADAIVCNNTDPAALAEVRHLFPRHLDAIVNVPAPRWDSGDPRAYSMSDLATAWRTSLDDTVLSAVLTLETVGDHLRSGGSIISVVPENPRPGSCRGCGQGRSRQLGCRPGDSVRHPRHHGERRCGRTQRSARLRGPDECAAVGCCRGRPDVVVPDQPGCPPHHRADAARQPRRPDAIRLATSPSA